jgi:uncharacterized repeat protein (TIGR01451 family)
VIVGDFNRDGRSDLVLANEFSANISVLLGRGDATFNPATNYAAGPAPSSVTSGDFNGDQKADLAVADGSATNVFVLLGNGNGSFQAAVAYPAGEVGRSVTVGDFNRDTRLDLAVANRVSADVSVLLGRGDGTFDNPTSYLVGVDPLSIAAGDFDGDTRLDLTTANSALFAEPPSVSVLLGRNPTGFRNAVNYNAGVSPRAVAVGDFNEDGRPDLAVANFGGFVGGQFTNSSISVLLGRGDGTFQNAVNYRGGDGPVSLIAADLNGNGDIDLAVANNRSRTVSVLSGRGDGTFAPAVNYTGGLNPRSVAAGDFNGDGQPDLAIANDGGALVLVNICLTNTDLAITKTGPNSVAAGDRITYTLAVTNMGPVPAPDTSLVDPLAGMSFVSVTTSRGNCSHSSGTVNCNFGSMPVAATATVTIIVDANVPGRSTNTATVTSSGTLDPNLADNSSTVITTVLPLVSLTTSDSSASESGANSGAFTFRRSGSTSGALTVNYTVAGTASNGIDYVTLSGAVTIPSGSNSVTLAVTPIDELVVEPTENVIVTLASDPAYFINPAASTAAVSIIDDDTYRLSINDVSVLENIGTTGAVFTVSLSFPSPLPITVNFFTADDTAIAGSDYQATNGILTFPPETTNQTVAIAILPDVLNEANETFRVNLFNPTNAVIGDGQGTGTINNDDPLPTLSINDITVAEGDNAGTNAIFTVSLSAVSGQTVTVSFATTNGTASAGGDYAATNGILTFAPGVATRAITVGVNGDLLNEVDETFLVNLLAATNAVIGDGQGVGTIIDNSQALLVRSANDEQPVISIDSIQVGGADVLINFTTVSNRHYRLERSSEVTGMWRSAVDDVIGTGGLVQVVDSGGAGQTRRFYRVRLLSASVLLAEGSSTNFSVRLAAPPANTRTVLISRTSGSTNLIVGSGGTLTFTADNWNVPQTVTINGVEDQNTSDDQATFTVSSTGLASQNVEAMGLDNDLQNVASCLGGIAMFEARSSGAGPFTYLWSKDGTTLPGETNDSLILTDVLLDDSGTYSVQITSPSYILTKSGTLVVNTSMTASALSSLTNCQGSQATFSTVASGSGPFTYQWRRNDSDLVSRTNSTLTVSNVGAADAGSYCVVVSGPCNIVTNCATLSVLVPTTATALSNLTNCPGSQATFSTVAGGTGRFTYQWRKGASDLVDQTNSTLVVTNVSAADAGSYCIIVAGACNIVTNCATLNVLTPTAASALNNLTNCPGSQATFIAVASGSGPFRYQWSKDGNDLVGRTNNTLVVTNVSTTNAGTYCVVVNGACNAVTNCATLNVLIPTAATALDNLTNCPGSQATFSTVASGSGPFTYQWRRNGSALSGQTNSTLVLTNLSAASAGTYCVVVTGACDRLTNCATLTVLTSMTATALSNLTNCSGSQATFSTVASGSGPFTYQWLKDSSELLGRTNSTLVVSNVSAGDAGTYCVMVSGTCNRVTNCATLTVLTPTAATELSNLTNCPGTQATFTTVASGSGPFTYQWRKDGTALTGRTNSTLTVSNVSAASAGTYCVVVNGACNRLTNCATLTVLTPMTATALSNSTNCPGSQAAFSTVASGSGPFNYQWRKGASDLVDQTNSAVVVSNLTAADAGSYCVVVSGTCNRVTNCATLTVLTSMTATALSSLTNCPGSQATFNTVASGSGPFTYEWGKDGSPLVGETNNTLVVSNASAASAGDYCVVVSGACNSVTNCATLVVLIPTAATALGNLTNCPGSQATFSTESSGSGPFVYQWRKDGSDLVDQTNSALIISNVTAADAGSYCVVVSGACNAVTNCATLSVLTPTSATSLTSFTECPGTTVTFNTVASGEGPFTYQWRKDGSDLVGQTNNALMLTNVSDGDTGSYCVVVSGACNAVTNCASLAVVPPPIITSPPTNQTVYVNSNATFSVSSTGNGTLSYQWRLNGSDLPGETTSDLTVVSAQPTNEGDYTVVVSNSTCSVTSSVATLTLFRDFGDAPDPTFSTLLSSGGARHLIVPGFYLGAAIDAENDGQPSGSAESDDLNGGPDDEDGVTFLSPVVPGLSVLVQVVVSAEGKLDAWVDFDGDGAWSDPGEQIFTNQVVNAGTNMLNFDVPLSASLINSFARFRFSSAGGLTFDGPAADGEVEDYPVSILPIVLRANAMTQIVEPGGNHPGSTAIRLLDRDVLISFPTVSQQYYRVERADDLAGNRWLIVGEEIAGTGAIVQVTDSEGAGAPSRFYRIILLPGKVPAEP